MFSLPAALSHSSRSAKSTFPSLLRSNEAVTAVDFDNTRPGDLDLDLAPVEGAAGTMLRTLLDARIEPQAFDVRCARLSDAFLAVTGGSGTAA